ncbi:MAG: thioredoxin domain-containing protein, partial [Thermoanaerobaculia bacterium]
MLALFAMATTAPGAPGATPVNRLAGESSPYLLQHRHNPVDWYPWGSEALARARSEDRPIFLSIGYSTCHWCHVMERESFENAGIAALLNAAFVSIKVDREERPDLDNVYMTACQLMTQSGGWPLTVILTPDGRPFFAGTYFPPEDRYGRPGMRTLLPRIAEAWKKNRGEIEQQASHVAEIVEQAIQAAPQNGSAAPLNSAFGDSLLGDLHRRFDSSHGGFSDAPKFPPHGPLQFLLFRSRSGKDPEAERMLRRTLDEMQKGGIFDHVGGGFHRYSVDSEWFIPHFEKMLYDNAQLLEIYSGAAALFGDPEYRETAERIFHWLEREMKTPEGAYSSALDADSEGVEGKYYLWTAAEIDSVLGKEEAPLYREAFGIRDAGNAPPQFEEGRGRNLPRRTEDDGALARRFKRSPEEIARRLSADQRALEAARSARVAPSRDDKVLTSWNALAVSALVHASKNLGDPALIEA